MSLDKFDYILAVAEEQTLTRAAKQLYISQPALTNYINKLEEELGVKLFNRSVTPVQVTQAGALYIERMKRIQQESNMLVNELRQMSKQEAVFNLGIGSTRGNHWLPLILPEFCRRHPDVAVCLHERGEEQLEHGLVQGKIDLAIGVLNTSYPELSYQEIVEETVLLAIPRSYACVCELKSWMATPQNPYYITGEEVGHIPFLLPYPGNGFYRCDKLLMEKAGIEPSRTTSYTNMNTAYVLASEGVGALFITPENFDRYYPQCRKKLAFCSLTKPLYTRRCLAGYRAENKHRELIDEMYGIILEKIIPFLNS